MNVVPILPPELTGHRVSGTTSDRSAYNEFIFEHRTTFATIGIHIYIYMYVYIRIDINI